MTEEQSSYTSCIHHDKCMYTFLYYVHVKFDNLLPPIAGLIAEEGCESDRAILNLGPIKVQHYI